MDNSITERVKVLINHYSLNANSFSKKIGATSSTINSMLEKGTNPSFDTINKIIVAFPLISLNWLVKGEGAIEEFANEIQNKVHLLEEPSNNYSKGVPYYDIDFTAGFLPIENSHQSTPDSYVSHPFFKGCDYVVRASGQSMAKLICHGDAIGLVKVNNWKDFFPFGEIYAIVTVDNFRMIKIITKGESDDYYTLISNPTDSKKEEFPPQQLKKSSIMSIFKVQASSHLF
jgi:SOS-response transcriptional repressor LexA